MVSVPSMKSWRPSQTVSPKPSPKDIKSNWRMSPAAAVTVVETVEVEFATLTLVLFAASPSTIQGWSPSEVKVRVPPATLRASLRFAASAGAAAVPVLGAVLRRGSFAAGVSAMTGTVTRESTIMTAISIARNFFMRESPSKEL